MIQCQHCGAFVPAEKAFCPNCSEPMEVEEKSNRSHSFSSDMMSTIRDDPEKYREMLRDVAAKKQQQQSPPPAQGQVNTPPPVSAPQPATPPRPSPTAYNQWQAAPPVPAPQSNSKRNLILGISVVAIAAIVIALLFVFKVI